MKMNIKFFKYPYSINEEIKYNEFLVFFSLAEILFTDKNIPLPTFS